MSVKTKQNLMAPLDEAPYGLFNLKPMVPLTCTTVLNLIRHTTLATRSKYNSIPVFSREPDYENVLQIYSALTLTLTG